ncbi:MAG: DUF3298 and DUF4163 domain-containing protein [Clostridia bacterium]|nr:DUF3298 and DUF4163 domain-containing protein [Clostridia bacterium]
MSRKLIIILSIILLTLSGCTKTEVIDTLSPSKTPLPVVTEQSFSTKEAEKQPEISYEEYSNENSDYNMTVYMSIPQVGKLADAEVELMINSVIMKEAMAIKDEFESWARQDYESLTGDMKAFPHTLDFGFDIKTLDSSIMSVAIIYYTYTGGAHGLETTYSYTFRLNDGTQVAFKELFDKNYDFITAINKEISDNKYTFTGGFDEYVYQVEDFKGITENTKFYIKDNSIVIYYNPYEIAAYAAGYLEFRISDMIPFSLD